MDKLPISSFFMPDEIDCSNSKYVVVDGMYRSYFYVDGDGYPTNVLAGWITFYKCKRYGRCRYLCKTGKQGYCKGTD